METKADVPYALSSVTRAKCDSDHKVLASFVVLDLFLSPMSCSGDTLPLVLNN